MLKRQPYINYPENMFIEWQQAVDEGKEVRHLENICRYVADNCFEKDMNDLAESLRKELINTPVKNDYPYIEPSVYEEIQNQCKRKKNIFTNNINENVLRKKIEGAWTGRIAGCLLGKPVECLKKNEIDMILKETDNYPMHKYIALNEFTDKLKNELKNELWRCFVDTINNAAPADDDTNYTVLALKLIEKYGKDFLPDDVLEAWLSWIPMFFTCTAERVAYKNAAGGLFAPETALYKNAYREWIGAQIRGDFYGYINPGNPHKAAELAFKDASISHVKNGIYGEMYVSAMIAAAAATDDIITIIEAGLSEIPVHSRLYHYVSLVLHWYREGITSIEAINRIHKLFDEYNVHHWCHTVSNAMIVTMALLFGEKDFGKSICLAVESAFDTDCNGATAGSILGMLLGIDRIPEYWYKPFNKTLITTIDGYYNITVSQLTEKTLQLIKG